jgi:hypothetical protein
VRAWTDIRWTQGQYAQIVRYRIRLLLRYLEFMADKPAPKNAGASLVAWGKRFTKGKAP